MHCMTFPLVRGDMLRQDRDDMEKQNAFKKLNTISMREWNKKINIGSMKTEENGRKNYSSQSKNSIETSEQVQEHIWG